MESQTASWIRVASTLARGGLGALLLTSLAVGCGGSSFESDPDPCRGDDCGPLACTVGDDSYPNGTSGIPASDGCNTCSCSDGNLACTEIGCTGPAVCRVGGVTYANGAEVPSDDCNTCSCEDGDVLCTNIGCGGNECEFNGETYPMGASFPAGDGCNTCFCSEGGVGCTAAFCLPEGSCTSSAECGSGEVCEKAAGACGEVGECVQAADVCLTIEAPVCGCDGQTYSNDCVALAQGVNVAYEGACTTPCWDHATCGEGSYCATPAGQCTVSPRAAGGGGSASADRAGAAPGPSDLLIPPPGEDPVPPGGSCQPLPDVCQDIYQPVCGCDQVTYSNACDAATQGANVWTDGECP